LIVLIDLNPLPTPYASLLESISSSSYTDSLFFKNIC
jgi:hypothetical protein